MGYLLGAGLTWPSVEQLRSDFPRWRAFLAAEGVTSLTPRYASNPPRTDNLMSLLINQASLVADSAKVHHLRNMTGIRPWKP